MKNQFEYQIGLDQICNINNNTNNIDPKILTCSVCFCINIDVKECKNKKCSKLFCGKCFDALANNKSKQKLCPYCRTKLDYYIADESLTNTIQNLKYFCIEHISCTSQFSYNDLFLSHSSKGLDAINECCSCKTKHSKWNELIKCNLCNRFCCDNKCSQRCFNCYTSICDICIKSNNIDNELFLCGLCSLSCSECKENDAEFICGLCNKALCGKCGEKCSNCNKHFCIQSKCRQKCDSCSKIKQIQIYTSCEHIKYLECINCYPKCEICKERKSIEKCSLCSILICRAKCSLKCKCCNRVICLSCEMKCSICKKGICYECALFCDKCGKGGSSLISCKNCNSDTLRKCNDSQCHKNLCLNCWNVCNTCNLVFCDMHSNHCVSCEETMCNSHYSTCDLCGKENKVCIKKCTFKCDFCNNISNALCKIEKHQMTFVSISPCEHKVCISCKKFCSKCKSEVLSCPKCIVNYYFSLCKYCNSYLCNNCNRICNICGESYCTLSHRCYCCNKEYQNEFCLSCFNQMRRQCFFCDKEINRPCTNCDKIFICSITCYYRYKERMIKNAINDSSILINNKITNHGLCEMFICEEHFNESELKTHHIMKTISQKEKELIKKIRLDNAQIVKEVEVKKTSCSDKFKCSKCIII